jgi:FAD/FMN-containing dehydrogenase
MKKLRGRKILSCLGLVVVLLALLTAHPVFHIARTLWNDRNEITPPPRGTADDASRLNQTNIAETWEIPTNREAAEQQLAALLQRARTNHLKVSIAGARHSMGGHTIYPGGVVIDMLPFNRMELDEAGNILHVQAGARWSEVILYLNKFGRSVEVMQSNDDFSVGGSISVNCHGWQFDQPPIASTVEAFRLMLADGTILRCSRAENQELFSLVLGGYGLFGIILDVDLRVVPNERYKLERVMVPAADYAKVFQQKTGTASNIAMVYGRLNVNQKNFLHEGIINVFHRLPETNHIVSTLGGVKDVTLKRAIFRGGEGSDYGKELRWNAEKYFDSVLEGKIYDRNAILYVPAGWFEDQSKATTDILVECFIPPNQFEPLVAELRTIIPRHQGDLLNVTVRDLATDKDSFLRYANQPMFSLVMFFSQTRDAQGEERTEAMTQEIIAAALQHGGRYYLPYRLHATSGQFNQAYPQAGMFFELKRKYDPEELFQNEFYLKYGKPAPAQTGGQLHPWQVGG